ITGASIQQFDLNSQQYTLWSRPFTGGGPVGAMEVSGDGSTVYYTDTYTSVLYADDAVTGKEKFRVSFTYYNPNVNEVQALALKVVGNTLYIGGLFFKVTDATGASYFQNGICAVDASTGALKNFNPQLNNSEVNYLDAHGNDLIIGGLSARLAIPLAN